jgi:hypothetical protein
MRLLFLEVAWKAIFIAVENTLTDLEWGHYKLLGSRYFYWGFSFSCLFFFS